ncbi:ImmA/IrrE family metallo-endopeptidase [Bacillus cereus]|nr:ImmA/IrrE family metallo-endopeptidase [Bacillus cereus]PGV89577.1 ImmA/IrrE family metallo-endopeptidase [Bacillus cereus]
MYTSYEKLLCKYENEVQVKETELSHGFKGLYYDGRILIDSSLKENEKHCILAEEIGHHYTSYGNIIDQKSIKNRKQEQKARNWGYENVIPFTKLVQAKQAHCNTYYEISEFLDVTQEFLEASIECYFQKYGKQIRWRNYLISFEPLDVIKM